ncbi:type I-E CRISPR-associated endoribonuclease Cas2e [Lacticaseibacillus thailandensis]|uniref:DNA polymerase III polC-type n=1 Tax=Lacticaseibacillus thailandensis DSM 22698 = JCM 13996 TaxID=1423810 RepID=A0A0R2C7U0_9LACO|nr:type I-E CRISPR-associated endoribonuclease Cas2e [Lacticaseibacillus thailandensis]KRM87623.1 3-5 exonuclease and CRISPR-associated Cas2 family protein [Lacticaseibacillus thailandensis DSM 22698 = JCM 13996]
MIVITLTKVPRSLRGDLTKWFQEIQTGVFVGSVSARIRDKLWDRVQENIGSGQATMVYSAANELGYQFKTSRTDYEVVDYDGIPLMMHLVTKGSPVGLGFSNAAKYRRAAKFSRRAQKKPIQSKRVMPFVSLDVETTGLSVSDDQIISIGALKSDGQNETGAFKCLINVNRGIPEGISRLTGITSADLITQGVPLAEAMTGLREFVSNWPIVGYNVNFDDGFLLAAAHDVDQPAIKNRMIDLLPLVKKANRFMDNYRLSTVLETYQITNEHPHNSTSDARATLQLALQLIKKGVSVF